MAGLFEAQNIARPSSRGDERFMARVYSGNGPHGQGRL